MRWTDEVEEVDEMDETCFNGHAAHHQQKAE